MEDVTQAPSDEKDSTETIGADKYSHDRLEVDATSLAASEPPPVYVRPVRRKSSPVVTGPQVIESTSTFQPDTDGEKQGSPQLIESAPDAVALDVANNGVDGASFAEATPKAASLEESATTVTEEAMPEAANLEAAPLEISTPDVAATPQPPPQKAEPAPEVTGLPTTAPAADLSLVKTRKRWTALCFGVTFLIYLAFVPVFLNYSSPPTGDQPFYLMDTISIVQDWDLDVKNNYDHSDFDKFYGLAPHPEGFMGMTAPYPLPAQIGPTTARPATEWYGAHPPGLAVALVPAWVVGSWFNLWWPATVIFMCLVGALVVLNAFLLAHELTGKLWIAFAVWLPIAFSSPIMTYSYMLFTELSTGLLVIYAFRRLALGWGANGPIRLILVGLCIGYIPWLAWRALPISVLLGLYALVQWWRYWRTARAGASQIVGTESRVVAVSNPRNKKGNIGKVQPQYSRRVSPWFKVPQDEVQKSDYPSQVAVIEPQKPEIKPKKPITTPRALLSTVWVLVPLVALGVLLGLYNRALYGSITPIAIADPNYYFHWPWAGQDNLIKYVNAIFGLLYDQQFGILPYAPIYLLSAVGAIALFRSQRRSDRKLLLWLAIIAVPYMAIVAGFSGWSGVWCPPARYLTTFAPLMAAPLGMSLYTLTRTRIRGIIYGSIYILLALPGLFFMLMLIRNARLMWPTERGAIFIWLANAPESPLKVDLLKFIPAHIWPDESKQPQLTAWAVGLSLGIVFLCYTLMARPRTKTVAAPTNTKTTVRRRGWPLAVHGLVWVGAGAVLLYGWFMSNYKHLEHKTILTEQQLWALSTPPNEARGIAYLDNKLYITAYVGQTLGVLDLETGVYTLIEPELPDGSTLALFHPGDVKAGPDGLLYLLNNGPDQQAMIVMEPNGRVVRQAALIGKTPIAIGLDFAPDGSALYVADMTGAKVIKYGLDFGDPLEWYGGVSGGFNNVGGVTIDKDGTIYAAEGSEHRVQQMDQSGKFVRDFKLECTPQYMAVNGEWLDLTCHPNILSINKQTGHVQSARYAANSYKPNAPNGITYGPDGTLYVLDGDKVIQYTVQH
ncbi:MAG TPA: SMP-30/gluconolactonase/LRE family protein [Chloroflexia bacterium]|nr:SMP-30/gluconolactonase/LRE family protein [Chloroflexia bacterium]